LAEFPYDESKNLVGLDNISSMFENGPFSLPGKLSLTTIPIVKFNSLPHVGGFWLLLQLQGWVVSAWLRVTVEPKDIASNAGIAILAVNVLNISNSNKNK
jgi:hypothetical protein